MSVLWLDGNVPEIKKLPDDEIVELLKRITPVITKDGKLTTIGLPPTLWNTAFLWSPTVLETIEVPLYELAIIETYHTCGYIMFFKPSISEVISQIPARFLPDVTHFETLDGDTVGCFSEGDGHRTVTKLYSTFSMDEIITRSIERTRAGKQ